jgi:hypothetical protein
MPQLRTLDPYLVFGTLIAAFFGFLVALGPLAAVAAAAVSLAAMGAVTVPPAILVVGAILAAVLGTGVASLGLAPEAIAYAHFPLAYGALALVLIRSRGSARAGMDLLAGIALFGAATMAAAIADGSEIARPALVFLVLAEPFAVAAALALDDGLDRHRRLIRRTLITLIAIQVPLVMIQFGLFGIGDAVQGTFYGSEFGAHLAGALGAVGLVWWLAASRGKFSVPRVAVAATLALVPLLTAAKQVVLALAAALILVPPRGVDLIRYGLTLLIVAACVAAIYFVPFFGSSHVRGTIQDTIGGNTGKLIALDIVAEDLGSDPAHLLFGDGPARSVSGSSFLTLDPSLKDSSPIGALGLEPSETAQSLVGFRAGGSTDSPRSSAIGLFGDLGLVGALAYLGLFVCALLACRRRSTPIAIAATAGLAMFAVLGIFDGWWEQAGLAVPVGALVGLALAMPEERFAGELDTPSGH